MTEDETILAPVAEDMSRAGAKQAGAEGVIRKITLKEIANIARVNVSTVSRALNDSPLITDATKEMVLAIAERMNYCPNSLARGLVSQKSETLGIILPKINFLQGSFFSKVLCGIEDVSINNGYNILIASTTSKNREKHFPFNLTRAKRIDGMLMIDEFSSLKGLAALKAEKFPFVFVNRRIKDPDVHCVASDNEQGGRLAAEHLIQLGHERIGLVTGKFNLASTQERLEGFKSAMNEKGVAFHTNLVREGLYENAIETGRQCAGELLSMKNPPTAIFAFSDEHAMGVIQAAKARGMKIPNDLAVIGYDNIEWSAHLEPKLTTISQNPYEIGSASCKMLVDLLHGVPRETAKILVPVKLIVRESCGQKLRKGKPADARDIIRPAKAIRSEDVAGFISDAPGV